MCMYATRDAGVPRGLAAHATRVSRFSSGIPR